MRSFMTYLIRDAKTVFTEKKTVKPGLAAFLLEH